LWLRGSGNDGGPTVVVVTCLGGSLLGWAGIADELEKHAQVLL
jgi:hypothetical protein